MSMGGHELKVDDWGIDAIYSGTQKCLSCPPGLSPVSFSPAAVEKFAINGASIDFARREVRFDDGTREELSERESDLLRYLVAQSGRAVPRDELLRQVWGIDPKNIATRTVDMHVAHLRQKLRSEGALVTVRGKGYMIGREGPP